MAKKTSENVNTDSLRENIKKLTILQNKFTKIHKNLLVLLKGYCYTIDSTNTSKKYSVEIKEKISEIQKNINIAIETGAVIRKLLSDSKKLLEYFKEHKKDKSMVDKYIEAKKEHITQITENQSSLETYLKEHRSLIDLKQKVNEEVKLKQISNETSSTQSNSHQFVENTLLISENQNKVILPYTLSKIKEYIANNPDKKLTVQQVIDTRYTVPLSVYKNSVFARFSEAFKLIRQREQGSVKDALDLAFEMAFNYSLHPAIITACNNLNELDIYLACLEYNELDDFKFFDINFEIAPTVCVNK